MSTIYTVFLLVVYSAIATFLTTYVVNIAGLPGAFVAGDPFSRSLTRFKVGTIVSSIGQSYVYLAFVAFMVSWTDTAAAREDVFGLLVWPVSFIGAIAPVFINLIRANIEARESEFANPQAEALNFTVLIAIVGFLIFVLIPSAMWAAWGWVPFVRTD